LQLAPVLAKPKAWSPASTALLQPMSMKRWSILPLDWFSMKWTK
jgi:hypothetical protein